MFRDAHEVRHLSRSDSQTITSSTGRRGVPRVASMRYELDRIERCSPFQWTFAHSRPVWNAEATDSTDPTTMEQNLKIRRDATNVQLQTRTHRRILELDRSRNRPHVEFQLDELVCIWRVPKGKNNQDHVGMETGLDQLGFLPINDGRVGLSTKRVCIEQHLSTSDQRRHKKCSCTKYTEQTRCPATLNKCCRMDKFPMASGPRRATC